MKPVELLLALAYGAPRATALEPPRKVLVIRRDGIGDMICTLPLLRRLRAGFPGARIDVLAGERNACILEGLPVVDRIMAYRRGRGLGRNHYFNLRRVMQPIRREGYDLAIAVMGGDFSNLLAMITYATGIPRRVGFAPPPGHPLDFAFNFAVPQPPPREHQIERCLRLAQVLGLPPTAIDLNFPLRCEHEAYARSVLAHHSLQRREYMLFNVSARPEGHWSPHAIVETARALAQRHGLRTLLCGVGEDRALLEAIGLPGSVTPSVHHFAALVRESRFLMCSDGGPMHVAAAMRVPVFVLFASVDPQIWHPWDVPFAYLRSGTRVATLTVEAVTRKLEEWLPSIAENRIRPVERT